MYKNLNLKSFIVHMKREGSNKKLQNTIEYITILLVVAILAIGISLLYMKNTSNVKLGNTDIVLAVAYFSGANGQPICNTTYQENQCFEILLTEPLPPYPVHNVTYWNNNEQSNPNFENEQDNYWLWINSPFSNQFYFPWMNSYTYQYAVELDNNGDVFYAGQVNGYYEYIIYAGPTVEQPTFLSSLELQYYSPNLLASFNDATPVNTTYILPIDGKPIPVEMYLNATSLINLEPEQSVQLPNFDNVLSVTEVGLTTGDSLVYSETFANGTMKNGSFPILPNSESTFVISNLTNQLPETVTLNISGEYSNGKTFGKQTFIVSDNTSVFVNFTQPAPIKLIATTSTIGPFVVTVNRNEPFSNLVITTGNTLANNGYQIDDAYITNVTNNHVEFFIQNPANIIYMNFNFSYTLSQNGPTGEAPNINSNPHGSYAPYDDGEIVFDKYTNFIGPSSGTFGSANFLTQNNIISAFTSGPFSFNANGNQTMSFTINDGLTISTQQNGNGYNENLYLPIQNGETYILGGVYNSGSINIGISNSTYNYYDQDGAEPMWTNGVFARGACGNLYLAYVTNSSNVYSSGCGSSQINFYANSGPVTYSTYTLNSNSVTITFPDGTVNKQFTEQLKGPYNFTMETFTGFGQFYYLAETNPNQPIQMEICQPPYSAPNTITCTI